jgi:hypothetical protein
LLPSHESNFIIFKIQLTMIYDENHNGIQLTSAEVGTMVTDPVFQGFFTKSDLEELLNQTDCVGIRVYNAVGSSTDLSRRGIGVGVRPNGTEKDARAGVGYILSQAFTGAMPANGENIGRDDARTLAELVESTFTAGDPRPSVHFASFFSKSTFNGLLANRGTDVVAGVGFFIAPFFGGFHTHIAVPYTGSAALQRLQSGNILSTKPCPGSCADLAPGETEATAEAATVEVAFASASGPYVIRW